MNKRLKKTTAALAVAALACAAGATSGGAKPNPYTGEKEAKFKVEVKGVQTSFHQHSHQAQGTCDIDNYSSGDEKVVFQTTKPLTLEAVKIPGVKEPQLLVGRRLAIPVRAKVTRSYTSRIGDSPPDCGGTGGATPTPPDCGTKTIPKWQLSLGYADIGRDRLELTDYGSGHDPFKNCPGSSDLGFPFLITTPTPGHIGKAATADLPASDLFDPKFKKWISIGSSTFKEIDDPEYRAQTKVRWEVSFTRLG